MLLALLSTGLVPPRHLAAMPRAAARPRRSATAAIAAPEAVLPRRAAAAVWADAIPLRIDGTWYDLRDYADAHPGGRWLLEYARGRDVTALFRSIHMRNEKAAATALARLPRLEASALRQPSAPGLHPSQLAAEGALQGEYVLAFGEPPETPPLPPIDSALRDDLARMLRSEFRDASASKATPAHWARIWLSALGTAACWAGWLKGSALACLLLPFVHWVLIAHTVHEATHGNLSTDPRVNYWLQFTSHPICFNVFVWIPQHLLSHHQYTNDYRHDVDCHHFAPALLSADQPTLAPPASRFNQGWTFVWKGFLTTLGTSILQPLRTLTEKATPNYDANLTPVPQAVSKRQLLASVLPSFAVLLYPLLAVVPKAPLLGLWLAAWPWVGMSLIFTCMTQVSHVQAATQPGADADADARCWTARQILTSLDYSVAGSRLETSVVTALAAGLNAQSLHHAMPSVSCAHFPRIYARYALICEAHGVPLRQSATAASAVREMLEYVFENNAPAARVGSQ